jgi:general secretion pathway protein I
LSRKPKNCSDGERGFTLIEALVALAIIAVVLTPIGMVIGTTARGTRAIDQRLALSGAAETLLASLPARDALKVGRQTGELAGYRWRIDIGPINAAAEKVPAAGFVPLAINMRMQGPDGATFQVTTVRLVPRTAE